VARAAGALYDVTRRVALLSPYALSVFGGVQEQVLAMSRELTRRGDEVLVVSPDASDRSSYDTPATVRHVGRLLSFPANGSRAPLTLSPLAARRTRALLRRFRPDVVHVHEPFAPLLAWSTLLGHEHATVGTFHRSGNGPALRLTGPLLRRLAKGLDVATAVSEPAADTIDTAAGVEATVLFNGLEMERFVRYPRERTDDTVLLVVGRLEARKGQRHAIEAVRSHNRRGADQWRLVVLGDGPDRARLETLAGHDGSVRFVGALDDEHKRAWMRRANVLLAPSTGGESFGLILLEAMASELAVVASDISGYREAADDHATLFSPGDDVSLEEAITRALTNETDDSIELARLHAERWSMSHLVDAYELLYDTARQRFETAL
jgi:phosphatidylinositol alpha-mannosyltransferase